MSGLDERWKILREAAAPILSAPALVVAILLVVYFALS